MSRAFIFLCLLIFGVCVNAESQTDYSVKDDEFGSGKVHRIQIFTDDTSLAGLTLACYTGNNLQGQITTDKTIFPNETSDGYMWLNVTYKSDGAESAMNSRWRMNMMKYDNAWLLDGVDSLASQMGQGELLSVRFDKSGTIYRFPLTEAQAHLDKVLSACSA